MSDGIKFEISVPSDEDGYILLQCKYCGNFFKITVDDLEDDRLLYLYCPSCGLISDNYFTDDVVNLALAKVKNYGMDMVYDAFKELERTTKKSAVQFRTGNKPKDEREYPIKSGIEALEKAEFYCCNRMAKVKPLLKMTGCYCPFCGVKEYEVE
ncbi:MAG: TFIIB-type zinc ribbon-containing protein [Oscillospiraceae bacterium]|nr:TFIIB-type zinc ribbon-containing protein [Oscillospiraceae bacterium]